MMTARESFARGLYVFFAAATGFAACSKATAVTSRPPAEETPLRAVDDASAVAPRITAPTPPTNDGASLTSISAESIQVGSASRAYVLAKPKSYSPSNRYPLTLVLHGDGSDGASIRAAIDLERASGTDSIVAYPSGHGGWNLYDLPETNDDLAFLVALVRDLSARFSIDTTRVFGLGFSSGAFMLNQMACRRPGLFRAIASHSGGAPSEPLDPSPAYWRTGYTRCAGQTAGSGPAVMIIHGTADTVVSFASGEFTASYWAVVDGCDESTPSDGLQSPCVVNAGCPKQRPILFCAIPRLGHELWPETAKEAWRFFRAL